VCVCVCVCVCVHVYVHMHMYIRVEQSLIQYTWDEGSRADYDSSWFCGFGKITLLPPNPVSLSHLQYKQVFFWGGVQIFFTLETLSLKNLAGKAWVF
jgi:hypothetical protein